MKNLLILFITGVLTTNCGGADSPKEKTYTFSEIIDYRMKNNQEIDGKTILIRSSLIAFFDATEGCAGAPLPCTEVNFKEDDGIPKYQGSHVGPCSGYGIMLIDKNENSNNNYEILNLTYSSGSDFYKITTQKEIDVEFHAIIKFVERSPFCSNQKNYGLDLTLKDGEDVNLLEKFLQ